MPPENKNYNPFALDCQYKHNDTNSQVNSELIKFIEGTFTRLPSLNMICKVNELVKCWKYIFSNTSFRIQFKNDKNASILLYKLTISVVFQYEYSDLPIENRNPLIKCIKEFIAEQRTWRCSRITNLPTIISRQHQWKIEVLSKITNGYESLTGDEIIQFFNEEKEGILIRITLLLSPLPEMNIHVANLAKSFLNVMSDNELIDFDINQTDIDYCWDTYLCALYHSERNGIICEIEDFPLDEAFHLMKRLQNPSGFPVLGTFEYVLKKKGKQFWKDFHEVVAFVNNKILLHTVKLPMSETSESGLMKRMIEMWFDNKINGQKDTMENILSMVNVSTRAYNCLPFCEYVTEKYYGKPVMMEYLIQITTLCMNDIETNRKNGNYSEVKTCKAVLSSIFDTFCQLFKGHKNIVREFVLTKFSLSPTEDTLKVLENMVSTYADTTIEVPTKDGNCSPSVSVRDSLASPNDNLVKKLDNFKVGVVNGGAKEIPSLLETRTNISVATSSNSLSSRDVATSRKSQRTFVPKKPLFLNEILSLSAYTYEMRESLLMIVYYQRPTFLSWDLGWPALRQRCVEYLQEYEETENVRESVKLNYLDLDYTQFEHIPRDDDYYEIYEKGYEQYALDADWYNDVPNITRENYESSESLTEDDDDKDSDYEDKRMKKAMRKVKSRWPPSRLKRNNKSKGSSFSSMVIEDESDLCKYKNIRRRKCKSTVSAKHAIENKFVDNMANAISEFPSLRQDPDSSDYRDDDMCEVTMILQDKEKQQDEQKQQQQQSRGNLRQQKKQQHSLSTTINTQPTSTTKTREKSSCSPPIKRKGRGNWRRNSTNPSTTTQRDETSINVAKNSLSLPSKLRKRSTVVLATKSTEKIKHNRRVNQKSSLPIAKHENGGDGSAQKRRGHLQKYSGSTKNVDDKRSVLTVVSGDREGQQSLIATEVAVSTPAVLTSCLLPPQPDLSSTQSLTSLMSQKPDKPPSIELTTQSSLTSVRIINVDRQLTRRDPTVKMKNRLRYLTLSAADTRYLDKQNSTEIVFTDQRNTLVLDEQQRAAINHSNNGELVTVYGKKWKRRGQTNNLTVLNKN